MQKNKNENENEKKKRQILRRDYENTGSIQVYVY